MTKKKMMEARPQPCKSCPYRHDVPSGVWSADEYDKLRRYDGDPSYQAQEPFACHQADGYLCSGWLGHTDSIDLLAVRIGVTRRTMSPDVLDYRTDVPLFASGDEAAEHGQRDVMNPGAEAREMIAHILEVRTRKVREGEDSE